MEGLVNRCCDHARDLVDQIGLLPGVEVLWRPVINQGLVRFLDTANLGDGEAHDRRTERVLQKVLALGEAFFMATTWRGRRALRVSVLNWQTNDRDVAIAVEAIRRCLG